MLKQSRLIVHRQTSLFVLFSKQPVSLYLTNHRVPLESFPEADAPVQFFFPDELYLCTFPFPYSSLLIIFPALCTLLESLFSLVHFSTSVHTVQPPFQ